MALDKTTLAAAIGQTFSDAKANNWSELQVADALADAIDAYVRGATVTGVTVSVSITSPHAHTGTGTQTGSVTLT
jgi:hypothetical protein